MIILPEISENSKSILIHTRPTRSVSILSEIRRQKGSLDNVYVLYIASEHLLETVNYNRGISNFDPNDPSRPGGPTRSQPIRFANFLEMCDDFEIEESNRIVFRTLDDFQFENGDNFIIDNYRMDLYLDFIKLGIEKGYPLHTVGSIIDSFDAKTDSIVDDFRRTFNYDEAYEQNDMLHRPFKDLQRAEVFELGMQNAPELFNKWDYKEREHYKLVRGEDSVKEDWATRPEPYKP